ncbi:MAG: hypothetical protein CMM86_17795 [Rhodovulum sp.]|nr:hypothetical protein [Rhodovulum sp.]
MVFVHSLNYTKFSFGIIVIIFRIVKPILNVPVFFKQFYTALFIVFGIDRWSTYTAAIYQK